MTASSGARGLRFRVLLLLGSFDPETHRLLTALKEALAAGLMSEPWVSLVLLVDDVELYKVDTSLEGVSASIIVEKFDTDATLFLVRNGELEEAFDVPLGSSQLDAIVADYAKSRLDGTILKLPILEKVSELATVMAAAFVIRHQELTRGGEYIELAYLIGSDRASSAKIWFFKREGVDLSQMAWEILDKYGIQMRPYQHESQLLEEAIRVARYRAGRNTDTSV